MNIDSRSKNCPEVTDQSAELTTEMTDKFMRMFSSGDKVQVGIYLAPNTIWNWRNHDDWLVSPRMFSAYCEWKETLPSLLKELA